MCPACCPDLLVKLNMILYFCLPLLAGTECEMLPFHKKNLACKSCMPGLIVKWKILVLLFFVCNVSYLITILSAELLSQLFVPALYLLLKYHPFYLTWKAIVTHAHVKMVGFLI